jgi:8-oxo-dGTP diphosphatase
MFKFAIAVVRDRRLLLCRPYAFDDLIMPGGIREGDESHLEGLTREISEELGSRATLDKSSLEWIGHFEDVAAGRTDRTIAMDVYLGRVEGELVASSEIKELVWFGRDSDPDELSPIVRNHVWPALVAREEV